MIGRYFFKTNIELDCVIIKLLRLVLEEQKTAKKLGIEFNL